MEDLKVLYVKGSVVTHRPKKTPEHHGKPYTGERVERITNGIRKGRGIAVMAAEHQRLNDAILAKAYNCGLMMRRTDYVGYNANQSGYVYFLTVTQIKAYKIWRWSDESLAEWDLEPCHRKLIAKMREEEALADAAQDGEVLMHGTVLVEAEAINPLPRIAPQEALEAWGEDVSNRVTVAIGDASKEIARQIAEQACMASNLAASSLSGALLARQSAGRVTQVGVSTMHHGGYTVEGSEGVITVRDKDGNVLCKFGKEGIMPVTEYKEYTMKIENITLIDGVNVTTLSDEALITKLSELEARKTYLSKITTKNSMVDAKIEEIENGLQALAQIMNDRTPKVGEVTAAVGGTAAE